MRRGDTGPSVVELQRLLVAWGYPLRVDGDYGRRTEAAVWAFQAAEGLETDGVAGPRTVEALRTGPLPVHDLPPAHRSDVAGLPALAIAAALRDLGAAEDPLGTNRGPRIAHLVEGYEKSKNVPREEKGWPWCAMAVSVWTADAMGLGRVGATINWSRHPFGAWLGKVRDIQAWGIQHGRIVPPEPGAIFCRSRTGSGSDKDTGLIEAGHCGLVEDVDGELLTTIDGNVSNRVARTRRPIASVRCCVRWWS